MKEDKLAPRISQVARTLWVIYLALTAACAFGYWLAGMSGFDAIAHAMSTVSTGGFSTHDASIAHFDSPAVEAVALISMLLGGINFALHFVAARRLTLKHYWASTEVRIPDHSHGGRDPDGGCALSDRFPSRRRYRLSLCGF